jgi:hypothetical protein
LNFARNFQFINLFFAHFVKKKIHQLLTLDQQRMEQQFEEGALAVAANKDLQLSKGSSLEN